MNALGIYGKPRTNDDVIKAWQNGVSARNHRYSLTSISYPNGSAELFSYDLKIGERTPAGVYVIADFTAPTNGFRSMTTSCHVNLAKYTTGNPVIMHPKVWECSPMSDSRPF
jgi:O-acetyl-ADP-ribose deacetylase (regulator of RNase III)